ncbi:helix-turn-helix domain-containing protein [Chitiniphilus purpureus]|uniref:helix-turn-helix domain-containing protein n=1 Tax=Chitiniphilus purpureus TaxID=2981137 RepID=UPI0038CC05A9
MAERNPQQIREARHNAGLTQTQAAELVHARMRAWQEWEAGNRAMPGAAWELFLIKTGQGPAKGRN